MSHKTWMPYVAMVVIIIGSAKILAPFATAMAWSSLVAMATWPLYQRLPYPQSATTALLAVLALLGLIMVPCLCLISVLGNQALDMANVLVVFHQQGYPMPTWLNDIPWLGTQMPHLWQQVVHTTPVLSTETLSQAQSIGKIMANVSRQILSPFGSVLLSIFLLFFWYRDGHAWLEQFQACLRKYELQAWEKPLHSLLITLRSTVNGSILTSLIMGLCLGALYACLQVPMAALLGLFSGLASMVPFVLPILLLLIWLHLALSGAWLSGLYLFLIGLILMLLFDNVVKPNLIRGHPMPFWMILLGILGGIKAFGLLGLFLGPMTMASLALMWQAFHCVE